MMGNLMSLTTAKEALHQMMDRFDDVLAEMDSKKNFMGHSIEFNHNGKTYGLKLYKNDLPSRDSGEL
jgi:hypothetical protein